MKFLLNNEKILKNGLYLDYFFKNVIFFFYKNLVGNNFIYLIDKYLVEKFFLSLKVFFSYIQLFINTVKFLNFNQILKLNLIIIIQALLIYYL